MRYLLLIAGLICGAGQATAQSFSCNYGARAACLDYGDTVCSSSGKCVSSDASCFDSYQCGYQGFTCKSNVTECLQSYEEILAKHNDLIDDYNELLATSQKQKKRLAAMQDCILYASTLQDVMDCTAL